MLVFCFNIGYYRELPQAMESDESRWLKRNYRPAPSDGLSAKKVKYSEIYTGLLSIQDIQSQLPFIAHFPTLPVKCLGILEQSTLSA